MIWNIPNLLSLSRCFLAFLFIIDSVPVRIAAILLGLATDCLDGYLARGQNRVTRFGTILDPIADRIFVLVASLTLMYEERLSWAMLAAIFARDIFLFLFWIYMKLINGWKSYRCRATLWGKITTGVQLFMLFGIALNVVFPTLFFMGLVVLGLLTFGELIYRVERNTV